MQSTISERCMYSCTDIAGLQPVFKLDLQAIRILWIIWNTAEKINKVL